MYIHIFSMMDGLYVSCANDPIILDDIYVYLKTVFAELQSKINFLARNKIYIVKIYNDTRDIYF
jgi:hypothetical protein